MPSIILAQFGSGINITCGLSLLDLSSELIMVPLGTLLSKTFVLIWFDNLHSIGHFHKLRHICNSFVFVLITPTSLTLV